MSEHRIVSRLAGLVIGSDALQPFCPELEAGISGSIWGQKMTSSGDGWKLCDFGGPICQRSWLRWDLRHTSWMPHLGSYRDQEPLGSGHFAPVGTSEGRHGVGERAQAIQRCALALLWACPPSFCCFHPSSAQFLLCTPPLPPPAQKE